jgi:DNA-binding IclR family transcriptional regulator
VAGTLKSVDHALAVMEYLAAAADPVTLTALSKQFGMSKSSMYRLLATLRDRGYVVKDPITARYRFGLTATRLAQQAGAVESLTGACWPAMRWLWTRTEETVLLAVRDGDTAVVVEKLDSTRPVLASSSLGRLMPLHAVSGGMALLASFPDAEIREILTATDLSRFTSKSVTNADAVWHDIAPLDSKDMRSTASISVRACVGSRPRYTATIRTARWHRSRSAFPSSVSRRSSIPCANWSWPPPTGRRRPW